MQLALFSLQKLLFEVINKLWYVVLINIYLLSVLSPWILLGVVDCVGFSRVVLGGPSAFSLGVGASKAMLGCLVWSSTCLKKYCLLLMHFYFSSSVLAIAAISCCT